MRVLRIAAARQLALFPGDGDSLDRWDGLPGHVQARVLVLLARMIAKAVLGPAGPGVPS